MDPADDGDDDDDDDAVRRTDKILLFDFFVMLTISFYFQLFLIFMISPSRIPQDKHTFLPEALHYISNSPFSPTFLVVVSLHSGASAGLLFGLDFDASIGSWVSERWWSVCSSILPCWLSESYRAWALVASVGWIYVLYYILLCLHYFLQYHSSI